MGVRSDDKGTEASYQGCNIRYDVDKEGVR